MQRLLPGCALIAFLLASLFCSLQLSDASQKQDVKPQSYTENVGGVGIEMVLMPAGKFLMGSLEGEGGTDEHPRHGVTISHPFYMSKYEVTQLQWKAVASLPKVQIDFPSDPSKFKGDKLPVEQVSWEEAVEFCERLSKATRKKYRLPMEAEWEYACRAGRTGEYTGDWGKMAWYADNAMQKTHPVGQKQANAFGLYDMHGNVWEWCADWYDEKYYASSPAVDPRGSSSGSSRVYRGGSWSLNIAGIRAANRTGNTPSVRSGSLGFRLAVSTQ